MRRGLVALAAAGAAAILWQRRRAAAADRVDLYFEDGSMQSVGDGTAEAARLLPLAREALRAARAG
jgi:hypothetical protein